MGGEQYSMRNMSTRKMVQNGLMIALVFLTTYVTRIPGPVPPGYINFGDAVIMMTAMLLGKNSGFVSGAIGSALADIASPGGIIFAPITFIVKGLEGYVAGVLTHSQVSESRSELRKIMAVVAGAAVMVAGYFFAELWILKIFDDSFGYAAAITELPFNLIQGGISAVVGYILTSLLSVVGIKRILEK